MTLIAQITDPHLRDDGADPCHDPAAAMRAAVRQISALDLRPEASCSLPGAPKRKQEQEQGQHCGGVAQRHPHPRAGRDPCKERGDHRRPRFQSSRRA